MRVGVGGGWGGRQVRELTAAARETAALAKEARARVPPPKPAPLFIGVPHNMPLPAV